MTATAERLGGVRAHLARPGRLLAAVSVALLLGAPLSVLYHVVDVAGDPDALLLLVAAALVASTLLARLVRPAVALLLAAALVAAGGTWYFLTLPSGIRVLASAGVIARDALALLSGLSVLQITNAGEWALAAAPAPTFLTWYLLVRRRYVGSAAVGGGFLAVFVLTSDAGAVTTLFGAVGAAGAVGFGELERRTGGLAGADAVAVVLAAMVVATLSVGVVPTGADATLTPGSGDGSGGTVEGSVVSATDRVRLQGSISLSPTVRFTVESDAARYWKVASYDRFAGDEWVRTGGERPYRGELSDPPGESRPVEQTVRVESEMNTMPAAWKPVALADARALVTDDGGLRPRQPLERGDSYRVRSQVLSASASELRSAGTTYPDSVRTRYLQLPSSTPDRVGERTARITANADNPYDTARVVERWLKNNKRYSLDVEKPRGNVADAFLFEMEAGYCTYFATTMVTMLRTQDIPARFVTGYTTGEQVDRDRWVVRGLNSHAWVEVYFPGQGWVRFDPTPAGPRVQAEQGRLQQARAEGVPNVDTDETGGTPTPTRTTTTNRTDGPTNTTSAGGTVTPNVSDPFGTPVGGSESGGGGPQLPSREQVGLGLIVVAGVAAGLHRSGAAGRAYRELWLRRLPDGPPARRVEGAFERLEYLLAERARERRPGETPRQYLAAVTRDERARRLGQLYERAVYAGTVGPAEATEAERLLADVREDRSLRERLGG